MDAIILCDFSKLSRGDGIQVKREYIVYDVIEQDDRFRAKGAWSITLGKPTSGGNFFKKHIVEVIELIQE